MLQRCARWGGRWSPRDFLRGRSKLGGAVHIRHTHGKQGRYSRLSSRYGLRDGRRHAENHLQGGLGVRLGGGLFGLRIPRQQLLSTMTREAYELEVYGHPNITNPYRHRLDEHPRLQAVVTNAALDVEVVVLLPRARRGPPAATTTTKQPAEPVIPAAWRDIERAVREVWEALHPSEAAPAPGAASPPIGTVHLTTLELSIGVRGGREGSRPAMGEALQALYRAHASGLRLGPSPAAQTSHRGHPFATRRLCSPNMHRGGPSAARSSAFTSASVAALLAEPEGPPRGTTTPLDAAETSRRADGRVHARGVAQVLRQLHRGHPGAVCVCLSSPTSAPATPARVLLRAEVDEADEGGSLWRGPRTSVEALLRWHYARQDPRAHNGDALPHHRRRQTVVIFVDASRDDARSSSTGARTGRGTSLLPASTAKALKQAGFQAITETSLTEVVTALRRWSVAAQWNRLSPTHAETRAGDPTEASQAL